MLCPIFLPRVVTGQCWSVEKQTKRRQRVLVRERIWSLNCWKSCKCDDTNDKSVFWWLAGRTKGDGFCWWSVEEEAKENTLSDVEELLNANWIHSFTFQFQATASRDVKKIRWIYNKNTKTIQRKYDGIAKNNTSEPTRFSLLHVNFVRLEIQDTF